MSENKFKFSSSWNFGPNKGNFKDVNWVIKYLCSKGRKLDYLTEKKLDFHETKILKINSEKAKSKLNWFPRWDLKTSLDKTYEWFDLWASGGNIENLTSNQINEYNEN